MCAFHPENITDTTVGWLSPKFTHRCYFFFFPPIYLSYKIFSRQLNKVTAAGPRHWTPSLILFNKQCHRGMLDLCNKWPCILYWFSIAVLYWCCIVRRISLDGKQRHLVYMKGASTSISHRAAAWPDLWLLSLRHIFLPTGDSLHGIALGLNSAGYCSFCV